MKRRYRKYFIERLLSSDDAQSIKEYWKEYTIKDAIFNVASAWSDLSQSNLKNGWNKLWPDAKATVESETGEVVSVEEISELCTALGLSSEGVSSAEVSEWLECDKFDGGFEILNDDEIVSNVIADEENDETDDDSEDVGPNQRTGISHSEAESMMTKCIEWYKSQEELTKRKFCILFID